MWDYLQILFYIYNFSGLEFLNVEKIVWIYQGFRFIKIVRKIIFEQKDFIRYIQ